MSVISQKTNLIAALEIIKIAGLNKSPPPTRISYAVSRGWYCGGEPIFVMDGVFPPCAYSSSSVRPFLGLRIIMKTIHAKCADKGNHFPNLLLRKFVFIPLHLTERHPFGNSPKQMRV